MVNYITLSQVRLPLKLKFYFYNIKEKKLDEHKKKKKKKKNYKENSNLGLKSTFAFFVNQFICDIIEDGFPISETILSEKAAGELDLLEMKEDQTLQMLHQASSLIVFWKLVAESKYPNSCLSSISTTYTVNLCTPQ